jgi:serine/threonine protein kinase
LHPGIVSCFYVREADGIPCVFAEYVSGGSLHEWIRDGRLYEGGRDAALRRILDICIQFAWGLGYAHERGVIHQDVKPRNVMISADGEAKITDFGLAQARAFAISESISVGGHTILAGYGGMTPEYCSPEQALAADMCGRGVPRDEWPRLSRRTDVWSFGVSVLEMFVGDVSWAGGQVADLALDKYISSGGANGPLGMMPKPLADLLRECLCRDESGRPRDMYEVGDRLVGIYEKLFGEGYPRRRAEAGQLTASGWNNRGISLLDLGREDEALAAFEEALKLDSTHPEAVYNRWILLLRMARRRIEETNLEQDNAGGARSSELRAGYAAGVGGASLGESDCKYVLECLRSAAAAGSCEVEHALRLLESLTADVAPVRTF